MNCWTTSRSLKYMLKSQQRRQNLKMFQVTVPENVPNMMKILN